MRSESLDRLQELTHPFAGCRPRHQDGRSPGPGCVLLQGQHRLDLGDRAVRAVVISFINDEDVRDFHEPGLERLHLVAGAWHDGDDRRVRRAHDLHLALANADGLDQNDVHAGPVHHERHVCRSSGEAAEVAAGRHAPNEHARVTGVGLHADPVPEDSPPAIGARRVDRDHTDRLPVASDLGRQPVDQRALANAGRSGHTDHVRVAGSVEDTPHEVSPLGRLCFDEGNGAGNGAGIASQDTLRQGRLHRVGHRCSALSRQPRSQTFRHS